METYREAVKIINYRKPQVYLEIPKQLVQQMDYFIIIKQSIQQIYLEILNQLNLQIIYLEIQFNQLKPQIYLITLKNNLNKDY